MNEREDSFEVATAPLEPGTSRLEASAGTGKTYTLAGLYLRLIAEAGLEIGAILVTTFTKPATAELRDRIRRRLHAAVAMFDDGPGDDALLAALHPRYLAKAAEIRPRLVRALRQYDDAAIYTIHGFCQRLLQERAFESGMPFDAEALEDQEPLLREVADDFWRRQIYPAETRIGAFAMLAVLSPASLAKLLGTAAARPTMEILPAWQDGNLAAAEHGMLAAFSSVGEAWAAGEADVRAIFADPTWAVGEMKKCDVTAEKLDALAACLAAADAPIGDYEALDFFTAEAVARQTSKRAKAAPEHALFTACSELAAARKRWATAFQREFLHAAPAELARRKMERSQLSYDDLLTRLRDALRGGSGSALVAATRERFAAALVDEFQDTDPVQAEIFQRLFAGHGRLYLIGDPKQAIYGFRGADVFSYLAAARQAEHQHELSANQRSVTPLVAAVNAIFSRNPRAFVVEGIDFPPAHAAGRHDGEMLLAAGAPEPAFHFRTWSVEKPVSSEQANRELPVIVADAIVEQLRSGATTAGRALKPSDFAVLVARNDQAERMQEALVATGLPAVVLSRARVFAAPEAAEMHAILRALAVPGHEPAVRAALATSALGLTAAELAALPEDRWERLLDSFLRGHARWLADGFFPAFRALLVEHHIRPRLLALPDGERRLTNLLHLAELLHHAATAERLGPAALVRWLATQTHEDASGPEAHELRLESDDDAVKVVTVHKSKGLEFGVVWCPFSWGSASLRAGAPITFHDPVTGTLMLDLGSPDQEAHRALAEREALAERTRLLYVALTRARLQCHFVWGRFNQCANSAANWVLHPPGGEAANAVPALEARKLEDDTLRRDLAALAAEAPGAFAINDVPAPAALRHVPPTAEHPPREARIFTGTIRRDWAIGSFSSLTARAGEDERDYDRAPAAIDAAPVAAGIHAFPRGRRAGTCLHEIFERLDFTDDAAIEPLVARKLAVFGLDRAEPRTAVAEAIRATLAVELAPGFRLCSLGDAARLNELEFHLPVGRLDPAGLRAVLGDELSFPALAGFLKGFIDLVCEHDGRFYILDWKSNWLGATADEYTADAIAAEMQRHHYGVQYHLYTVALHRHLARRVPDYDYDRHFGGVFYVFVRGVDPRRPTLGIFHDRPSPARLAALDALLSTPS